MSIDKCSCFGTNSSLSVTTPITTKYLNKVVNAPKIQSSLTRLTI